MDHDSDKIHVMPTGESWEIENQSGDPLAQEAIKEDAIERAKLLAYSEGIETVILHDGDGVTEEVPVPSEAFQPQPNR